jgi:outer membrane receptor protein involved in Fe transport
MIEPTPHCGRNTISVRKTTTWIALVAGLAAILPASGLAAADLDRRIEFHIPAQPLDSALLEFSRQASVSLAMNSNALNKIKAPPVNGSLIASTALSKLLVDTGLQYATVGNTVTVAPQAASTAQGAAPNIALADNATRPSVESPAIAQASGNGNALAGVKGAHAGGIEEVIVSAQKREERLQDVPVPVTALSANELVERNQTTLKDYFTSVPGLNMQSGFQGASVVSIRGINSGLNPTMAMTIDDVPFGSSLYRSGGALYPDLDPNDLSRVEILRGPQGTLYGVNSLGGLIKYVTVDPSFGGVSGDFQSSLETITGAHTVGHSIRGAVNVPVNDILAIRASAFSRSDPGYIDNPGNNLRDVNSGDAGGGLFSALLKPSDVLYIKLTALYQKENVDGSVRVDPKLGDLKQTYFRDSGWSAQSRQAYSATISANLGSINLVSLTGYNKNRFQDALDLGNAGLNNIANTYFPGTKLNYIEDYNTKKFSEELRASASVGEFIDLLLGGFYTHESFRFPTNYNAASPLTGVEAGVLELADGRGTYTEYAGFGDLTLHFTDTIDLQLGGRKSHNSQDYSEVDTGVTSLVGNGLLVIPNSTVSESPFTYLITPQYKPWRDLMIYGRFASGYRAGGINLFYARGYPVPPGFKSDKTYNYELGAKGSFLDHRLSFDSSLFFIDWKNLQINYQYAPGIGYTGNGSRAKSEGVEFSLEARPFEYTVASLSMSYDIAELTESFGASTTRGVEGDRLPFTSKFAGNLSLEQRIPFAGGWVGVIGASAAYVGNRVGAFTGTALRQYYPAYTQVDLHAGYEVSDWRVSAYVKNAGDSRGIIGGGIGVSNPALFNLIQPRTIGVYVSKAF